MSPTPHHARRSTDPPPEDSGEVMIIPKRLQSIDHNTRGSADAIYGAAEVIRRVAEDFSSERRTLAADRTRYEMTFGPAGSVTTQVEKNRVAVEALNKDVQELKGWVKWATGALAALGLALTAYLKLR